MKKSITKKLEVRSSEIIQGKRFMLITDIHGVTVGYIAHAYDNGLGFTGHEIIESMTAGKVKVFNPPMDG